MFERHRKTIQALGKSASSALRIHDLLKERVILSLGNAEEGLKLSFLTVAKAMANLERLGIVKEFTGKQRHRLFSYHSYLDLLG